jgi:hypothetical protein
MGGRLLVDIEDEISWTLLVNSRELLFMVNFRGHFLVNFRGHFFNSNEKS